MLFLNIENIFIHLYLTTSNLIIFVFSIALTNQLFEGWENKQNVDLKKFISCFHVPNIVNILVEKKRRRLFNICLIWSYFLYFATPYNLFLLFLAEISKSWGLQGFLCLRDCPILPFFPLTILFSLVSRFHTLTLSLGLESSSFSCLYSFEVL